MKKIIVLLIFYCCNVSAQQDSATKKIAGSWLINGYQYKGQAMEKYKNYFSILSFYKDSVSTVLSVSTRVDSAGNPRNDTFIVFGKWKLTDDNKKILISNQINSEDHVWEIYSVATNSLVLSGRERKKTVLFHYNRIDELPELKRKISGRGTSAKYYFVNSLDSLKKREIKPENELGIQLSLPVTDSTVKSKTLFYDGLIIGSDDSVLKVKVSYEYVNTMYKNGLSSTATESFYSRDDGNANDSLRIRNIFISNVSTIQYTSPFKNKLIAAGSAMTFLSAITTLFVAPLVSINYRNGTFNGNRYFKWAGYGLGTLAVGITVAVLGNSRNYKIAKKKEKFDKNFWYLVRSE